MPVMLKIVRRFLRDDSAATSIEYALIAALIGIVIITGVKAVGTKLSTSYSNLATNLK
jgi:pilus assembly protein Flp/PilA